MTESEALSTIAEAIKKIQTAENHRLIANYIRDALSKLQASGTTEDDAVHMLKTAVVSTPAQNPNLFHAFTILEKPTPPPTQAIIKGGWTYRVERPLEQCVSAVNELAQNIRTNSRFFVTSGPKMLTPEERDIRQHKIEELAEGMDKLATQVPQGTVSYRAVEELLQKLRELGFFPDNLLVSNLARAFVRAGL